MSDQKRIIKAEELMLQAGDYVRNARRFLSHEAQEGGIAFSQDMRVSENHVFSCLEKDPLTYLLAQSILSVDGANEPDHMTDVCRAIQSVTEAATTSAERIGAKWGRNHIGINICRSNDPIGQYAKDGQMRQLMDEILVTLEKPRGYLVMGEYLEEHKREADRIHNLMISAPLQACAEAEMLALETGYKALQAVVIQIALHRAQTTLECMADCLYSFPLIENGQLLKQVKIANSYTGSGWLHHEDFTGLLHTLGDDPLKVLFESVNRSSKPEAQLVSLSELYKWIELQDEALAMLVAGYLVMNQKIIMAAVMLKKRLADCETVKSITLDTVEQTGKTTVCRIMITTPHRAKIIIIVRS